MSVQTTNKTVTVNEFYRLAEMGVYSHTDRVELIEGEIVEMSPIGSNHAGCVDYLNGILSRHLGSKAIIRGQNPIRFDSLSEPLPDIVVLKYREDYYRSKHPEAKDALLIIEVADSSLDHDRNRKVPLYAQNGIEEVWIVNLLAREIEVYRHPEGERYKEIKQYHAGQTISPMAFPEVCLSVEEIIG